MSYRLAVYSQCEVSVVQHALQWIPHGRRGRGPPKNTWKRDIERKHGQQDTRTAGWRWKRQRRTELDGEGWSLAYMLLGATRLKFIVKYCRWWRRRRVIFVSQEGCCEVRRRRLLRDTWSLVKNASIAFAAVAEQCRRRRRRQNRLVSVPRSTAHAPTDPRATLKHSHQPYSLSTTIAVAVIREILNRRCHLELGQVM